MDIREGEGGRERERERESERESEREREREREKARETRSGRLGDASGRVESWKADESGSPGWPGQDESRRRQEPQ